MMRFFTITVIGIFLLFSSSISHAQEFRTDYEANYAISPHTEGSARVTFKVTLTNKRPDVYVETYSLSFPAAFEISDITAADVNGEIIPSVRSSQDSIVIELKSNGPHPGADGTMTFIAEFTQGNLYRNVGAIREIMIPTISDRGEGTYKLSVVVPNDGKRLTISKPVPDSNENTTVTWINPIEDTVYAVYGEKQAYRMTLAYDVENSGLTEQDMEIALPPDTLYQKVYVDSLDPQPLRMRRDNDGNLLAVYTMMPKSKSHIVYKGYAQVSASPRDEVRDKSERQFRDQKSNLLKKTDLWSLLPSKTISELKTPEQIYSFVRSSLSYDYDRSRYGSDRRRYGAKEALKNPDKAVCLEYSDTFVAIARTNGLPAREIQGYAHTDNPEFRPATLIADLLHSWPEYYDEEAGLWRQIDPMWQDTAGIDYFNSFDLNHVAFAIHGEKENEPLPAGMYKVVSGKNVSVEPTDTVPDETKLITVASGSLEVDDTISDSSKHAGSFVIVNSGNVYRYDVGIQLQSEGLQLTPERITIPVIAPGEMARAEFTYRARSTGSVQETAISAQTDGQQLFTQTVRITPASYNIAFILSGAVIIGAGILIFILRTYVLRSNKAKN